VLGILSGTGVEQSVRGRRGQAEGVIQFALGEQSGVTGDGGAVKLQLELVVEIDAEGVIGAFTHWGPRSEWQEIVENAGVSRVSAQISCRNDRVVWKMWVYAKFESEYYTTWP
jgi:hypothetical protein